MSKRSWLSNFAAAAIVSLVGAVGIPATAATYTNTCICQAQSGCYAPQLQGTETCPSLCSLTFNGIVWMTLYTATDDSVIDGFKAECTAEALPADFSDKLAAAKAAVPAATAAAATAATSTSKTAYCVCKEANTCSKGYYTDRQVTHADVCKKYCGSNTVYYAAPGETQADATAANASGNYEKCLTETRGASTPSEPVREYISPNLEFPFPDLIKNPFSKVVVQKDARGNDAISVNWIGEYISALYNYLLGISVTIAIVLIMVGGLQYVMAAGGGDTKLAKQRITNAATGLVLLFCVYLLLFLVNPALTLFRPLTLTQIKRSEWVERSISEVLVECKQLKGTVKACASKTLAAPSGWDPILVQIVNQVAAEMNVDPILLAAHLQMETRGDIKFGTKRGPCGEIGPAQFMPTTFDSATLGQPKCCTAIARKGRKPKEADVGACGIFVEAWPPPTDKIPTCNTSICGNCQQAAASCIDSFNTVGPDGSINKQAVKNVVQAQARFIKSLLQSGKVGNDLALEMCAYNGSGKAAMDYARKVSGIYSTFCTASSK